MFRIMATGNAEDMVEIGYTMMTEQAGPRDLVEHVVEAERVGFDFSVTSDHYFPWLESQGHAPYAWSVLGAAAQATVRMPFMTYVTCPTSRCHPAVVAQKAATLQLLSEGRFRLGLGSGENLNEHGENLNEHGENLNEHVVGGGWPSPRTRLEMLEEAVEIIRELFGAATCITRARTSRWRTPGCGTCRTNRPRSGWPYPASGPVPWRAGSRISSSPPSPSRNSSRPSTEAAAGANRASVSCPSATTRTGRPR
jgi:alkanesulfonate monooxygenase SsuD/methylene tetrahydromethanopterin reductase-like flavin-dependent oxidoreductase (luciferase family)